MDHNSYSDYDLQIVIENMVEEGLITRTSVAYSVALQAIHTGRRSLCRKSRAIYDAVIAPALKRRGKMLPRSKA